jgi:hypothetical protein
VNSLEKGTRPVTGKLTQQLLQIISLIILSVSFCGSETQKTVKVKVPLAYFRHGKWFQAPS